MFDFLVKLTKYDKIRAELLAAPSQLEYPASYVADATGYDYHFVCGALLELADKGVVTPVHPRHYVSLVYEPPKVSRCIAIDKARLSSLHYDVFLNRSDRLWTWFSGFISGLLVSLLGAIVKTVLGF